MFCFKEQRAKQNHVIHKRRSVTLKHSIVEILEYNSVHHTDIGGCMYKLTVVIVSPGNTSDAAETVSALASSPG